MNFYYKNYIDISLLHYTLKWNCVEGGFHYFEEIFNQVSLFYCLNFLILHEFFKFDITKLSNLMNLMK
uniref:Uncharacterized protein n=1 Tax=Strigamia maritima TaxID=126957 RepID=T1JNP1_STRMM